jgi:hypothetical protein
VEFSDEPRRPEKLRLRFQGTKGRKLILSGARRRACDHEFASADELVSTSCCAYMTRIMRIVGKEDIGIGKEAVEV